MIIIGDTHIDARLGNIRTRDLISEKKDKLLELINKEDMVVFLGDYFNVPEPGNEYRYFWSEFLKEIKIPKRLILGNHDIDNETQQNSLAAITPYLNDKEIVDTYQEIDNVCLMAYQFNFDKLDKIITQTKCRYILGHFSFDYELHGRVLKGELEYNDKYNDKQFILGHIHRYHQAKSNVIYLGALAPSKLDELGFEFKIGYINNGEFSTKNVKHNVKQKVVKTLKDLEDIDERTSVIFDLPEGNNNDIINKLKDKKLLNYKVKSGVKTLNVNELDLSGLLQEYLKIIGRPDLYDRVLSFIDTGNMESLLKLKE